MPLDQRQVESAVLLEVIELHPNHSTPSELVRKMSGKRDEGEQLRDAIRELEASDLLRERRGVVEPTRAALRAVAILTL